MCGCVALPDRALKMSRNTGPGNDSSLSRNQVQALGALAEELGQLDNNLRLSYTLSKSRAAALGPEVSQFLDVILIYLSGKALDAATTHVFDSAISQTIQACRRWFRKLQSKGEQPPTRRFAILDQDGNEILRFEIREGETIEEVTGGVAGHSEYAIDLVFVIDVSGTMSPVMDSVKESVLSFQSRLSAVMEEMGKVVRSNRVRVIAFRNFLASEDDALESTEF